MLCDKLQINVLERMTKDYDNFKKADSARLKKVNYLQTRIKILEEQLVQAKKYHEIILGSSTAVETGEKIEQLSQAFNKIEDIYSEYKIDLLDALDRIPPAAQLGLGSSAEIKEVDNIRMKEQNELRLPVINIPTFSGNYETWRAFHDMFLALIHNNSSLSDVQRLHYLKSSVSGEAERLLQHLAIDKNNYQPAWEILTGRYDHKRVLVNTQLKLLFGQTSITNDTSINIKRILDTSQEIIHALKNLELPVESWDVILIYVILQKLTNTTQQLWEERLGSKKELPTLKEFVEFLECRFRSLEAVEQQVDGSNVAQNKSGSNRIFHIQQERKKQVVCRVCMKSQHAMKECRKFLRMDVPQRKQAVRTAKVCENCLAYSHYKQRCPSAKCCHFCNQRHHTLLHENTNSYRESIQQVPSSSQASQPSAASTFSNLTSKGTSINAYAQEFQPSQSLQATRNPNVSNFHINADAQVLLATALVNMRTSAGAFMVMRALIDPGSEASFITEAAVQRLNLKARRTSIKVNGLGMVSSGTTHRFVDVDFKSLTSSFAGTMRALIFKSLTGLLPAQQITYNKWTHLRGIQLADPTFHSPAKIDILLGSDVYSDIVLGEVIRNVEGAGPIAQNTQLGWILLGKLSSTPELRSFSCQLDLDTTLQKFWEIEEEPFRRYETETDSECEAHFVETTRRLQDGRFEVCLPFKGGKRPTMGPTRQGAIKRFLQLEKKLQSNPTQHKDYVKCISEYLELGHMTLMEESCEVLKTPFHYFIPHHAVIKEESTTTRLRVVFDATFKSFGGSSLNDHLLIGPKQQQNVMDIILRWRLYRYAFTGDVEKMYRQIQVNDTDANYQMIVWRADPREPLQMYRLGTVTFGTASAPYLAIRVLRKLAEDEASRFPLALPIIRDETYVDDVISGADSIEEARHKLTAIKTLLGTAGFKLRKHVSNSAKVLQHVPVDEQGVQFSVPIDEINVKTLGVRWLPVPDAFCFHVAPMTDDEPTKRAILSSIARLYDPMGWISPFIIKAKIMMQKLWWKGLEWDAPLPLDIKREWSLFREQLPHIEKIVMPRWVNITRSTTKLEIHGFSDASEKAYAAAIYLRALGEDNKTRVHLLFSKAKVAPLKSITLPRLELCGAVLMATLLAEVIRALKLEAATVWAWTDSVITLCWIRAPPSKWKTFIANRVSQIQRLTSCSMWKHIPSELNPADLASRGVQASNLVNNTLWWHGPEFLRQNWGAPFPEQPSVLETQQEAIAVSTNHHVVEEGVIDALLRKHSNLQKIVRIVAYCLRFALLLKGNRSNDDTWRVTLTTQDLESAFIRIIKAAQHSMFSEESTEKLNKFRGLEALNPFKDVEGVLRVGGRLANGDLSFGQKHPILLKQDHPLSKLIVKDAHEKTLHGGNQKVTAYIRQRFWIFNLKNAVKHHIHKCCICYRFRAKPMVQLMGNLPPARTRISRPFTHAGVDYAGPIDVKTWRGRNAKQYKGYFAIFVCMATKAVHIELVTDMTTQAFIAAFRRFVARRGLCREVYSDCGRNFIGADGELRKLFKEAQLNWREVANNLASDGTTWKFIPPASPHFGGLWEAGVKSVKFHLKRIAGNQLMTSEELITLLTQIEACLNSRPLCPQSDDVNDLQPLTPGHFLIGSPLVAPPQPHYELEKISHLERWKRVQTLMQSFWKRWSTEYLSRLQQRPKWTRITNEEIKIGDLVLIKDERLPPLKWGLARIKALHLGADGIARVATVKTSSAEMKRPITKLCPLPTNASRIDNTVI